MGKTPGRSGNTSYQKTNLEDSRTSLRTANIEVQVTNLTQEPDQVKLEWYFVADPYGRRRLWIYDRGTRTLAIEPGRGEKFQVAAAPLENATTKNVSLYQTNNPNVRFRDSASVTKSGAKPAGWIVRMTAGDQLIDARASNSELETTARDPIKWGQLLEAKPPQLRP